MKNRKAHLTVSFRKILLVQLFSNGDCLYATTVARQIKEDYPGCHVAWAIANYCSSIIVNNPFVDEIIEIPEINYKNWKSHWSSCWKNIERIRAEGKYDRIVFTQLIASNYANYDYCIRSSILRGYDQPITVPVQPILKLLPDEVKRTEEFINSNNLLNFRHRILFEFAPRSGQGTLSAEGALAIARRLTASPAVAIILSSNLKLDFTSSQIIDGSVLSLRETASLSRSCTLLVGSSSGITWATTSDAGKELPMVQILDSNSYWLNSVVSDHKRFSLPIDHIIEMDNPSANSIEECVNLIVEHDFSEAKSIYHVDVPQKFMMTRGIIIHLLGKGDIKGVLKHININLKIFGWNLKLLRNVILGIITFPIFFVLEKLKKVEE